VIRERLYAHPVDLNLPARGRFKTGYVLAGAKIFNPLIVYILSIYFNN